MINRGCWKINDVAFGLGFKVILNRANLTVFLLYLRKNLER